MKVFSICLILYCVSIVHLMAQDQRAAFPCTECDHLVESNMIDGKALNIKPGEVLCLTSRVYDRLTFKNILGTPENPIEIRNCGGTARIYSPQAFGVKFQNSQHFLFTGDGGPEKYGIKITTEKGFYLTLESFTSDFEISRIEIAGPEDPGREKGFAGIGAKTSPYEDCELFTDPDRKAWVMENVKIHNNYIHDVGGEGLYIGHGFYKGRAEPKCRSENMQYSHSIRKIEIYDNLIEHVGYDGIQIKNADEDVLVYHNIIRNYGVSNHPAHNEGLFIGEGSTGEYYGNIIDTGSGNGCQIQGLGNIDFHDNLLINPGEHGLYASNGKFVVRLPNGYFNVHNNTILNAKRYGMVFYNDEGGKKIFSQNLVVGKQPYKEGSSVILHENAFTQSANSIVPMIQSGQKGINLAQVRSMMESYLAQYQPLK